MVTGRLSSLDYVSANALTGAEKKGIGTNLGEVEGLNVRKIAL